jgi:hypothetical protein
MTLERVANWWAEWAALAERLVSPVIRMLQDER